MNYKYNPNDPFGVGPLLKLLADWEKAGLEAERKKLKIKEIRDDIENPKCMSCGSDGEVTAQTGGPGTGFYVVGFRCKDRACRHKWRKKIPLECR